MMRPTDDRNAKPDRVLKITIDSAAGHRNLGDELILAGMLELLRPFEADVLVLSADPRDTSGRHDVAALLRLGRHRRKSESGTRGRTLRRLFETDVYIIGGGALITDERGLLPLLRYALNSTWMRIRGSKVVLLGVTIGPIYSKLGDWLCRFITRRAAVVWCRDASVSLPLAERLGGDGQVFYAPDLALLAPELVAVRETTPSPGSDRSPASVVIAPRDVPPTRQRTGSPILATHATTEHVQSLACLVDEIVETLNVDVTLLAMQSMDFKSSSGRKNDAEITDAVRHLVKQATRVHIEVPDTADELLAVYSHSDLVISERLHAAIVARAMRIPTIPVVYHDKFAALHDASDNQESDGQRFEMWALRDSEVRRRLVERAGRYLQSPDSGFPTIPSEAIRSLADEGCDRLTSAILGRRNPNS